MTAVFIFLILAWSLARGLHEGIVMYFPNPRAHPWFGWYHFAEIGEMIALAAAAWVFAETVIRRRIIAGAVVLSWEAFEAAYLWARIGQAANHENILGIYPIDGAAAVIIIHTARILIGTALIIGGKR